MPKQQPWFVQERSVAFASLVLTRRKDVIVHPQSNTDEGVDLLVEIRRDGKRTLRFFGVQLIGCMDLPSTQDIPPEVADHSRNGVQANLPLCAFVIGVRQPEGIYRWLVEPVVEAGRPSLVTEGTSDWLALDEEGVAHLVEQVNVWYDALQQKKVSGTVSPPPPLA